MGSLLSEIEKRILNGESITPDEAYGLLNIPRGDTLDLITLAHRITQANFDSYVDICSILNAKSGQCTEDCSFCVQSVHYDTGCQIYPMVETEKIIKRAQEAERMGAQRFCIVTSGSELVDDEFDQVVSAIERIRDQTNIKIDCSLGSLTREKAVRLKEAGLSRYNHNLETAKSNFSNICTTHSYEDRIRVVKMLGDIDIEVCCGGIIGLGETQEQRIELAFYLKELMVDCVPINILIPRQGTPLETMISLNPMEVLITIAVFRLILPKAIIKLAGGRETNLRDLQALGFLAGANGLIIGEYLTTQGRNPDSDIQMLKDLKLKF